MNAYARSRVSALLAGVALSGIAHAVEVSIPVSSSDSAAWLNSAGGTGTGVSDGGPAIWNTRFMAVLPPDVIGISFTLDTMTADDKGVMEVNGGIIADAVVLRANGTAAGAGTFDFGLGAGNDPYNFLGFTPGTSFPLPDGTTEVTVLVYMNDTGTPDPAAPPLPVVFISSSVNVSGTLKYDDGNIFSDSFEDSPP